MTPLSDNEAGCSIGKVETTMFDWIVPRAFAQSSKSAKDISLRLKSDDLFTRRDARIDLSKQKDSVETARELLNSNDYRLQLGALVALSILPEADRKNLPPDVMAKVRDFKTNSDPTIRETAARIEAGR